MMRARKIRSTLKLVIAISDQSILKGFFKTLDEVMLKFLLDTI